MVLDVNDVILWYFMVFYDTLRYFMVLYGSTGLHFATGCYRLIQITIGYIWLLQLLQFTQIYYRLLKISTGYCRLQQIISQPFTGEAWSNNTLFSLPWSSVFLLLSQGPGDCRVGGGDPSTNSIALSLLPAPWGGTGRCSISSVPALISVSSSVPPGGAGCGLWTQPDATAWHHGETPVLVSMAFCLLDKLFCKNIFWVKTKIKQIQLWEWKKTNGRDKD